MARDTVEFVTLLYSREDYVAEVTVSPQTEDSKIRDLFEKEIRVTAFSQQSERCLPLQVLHTIGSAGVYFKLRGSNQQLHGDIQNLSRFYGSCLNDAKTAVVILEGGNEVHLVAMSSGSELQVPCFWAYLVGQGLYASCLQMFNMRCLSIVFDLDETLIVANTQRSFELKMDTLKYRTPSTAESVAELKRYQEDRAILKQYIESDTVFVNGRAIRAQNEVVPPVSEGALPIMRPIIRVPERNMILTRINPAIRDTSVLVKLRPAWDDLRSYVIAKGRKRFEVYICTMSERDYALEMWRLLDPEGQLINVKELNDRVVCVESGGKKSLASVFARHTCHPKMAMVIDDRMKVWDEKDQARVHVVTPFAPYGAPQAEMVAGAVPVLYVARNVACSVRGGFFRDFDDSLHLQMTTVRYDTDLASLPSPPDVSNYLDSQEAFAPGFGSNVVSKDLADGIASSELESRIPQEIPATMESRIQPAENEDLRLTLRPPVQPTQLFATSVLKEPAIVDSQKEDCHTYLNVSTTRPLSVGLPPLPDISKASSPAREEGEVPESELDPDTRRRLLILQHGQDTGQAHAPLEKVEDSTFPPLQVNLPSISSGGWLGAEEEMSPRQLSRNSPLILEPESPSFDRMNQVHFQLPAEGSFSGERDFRLSRRRYADEGFLEDQHRTDQSLLEDLTSPGNGTHVRSDAVTVLQGIGEKCKHVVEYRILPNASQVSVEVMFGGEKIGEGVGRTKQEAKLKAAEHALRCLAGTPPMSSGNSSSVPSSMYSGTSDGRVQRRGPRDSRMVGAGLDMPIASTSGQINYMDYRPLDEPVAARTQYDAVLALTELCQAEGLSLTFSRRGFQCHVEVGGKLLGKGSGPSWESARQQGAEDTLRNLQPQHTSGLHKRTNAPRSPPLHSNKRPRVGEFLRGASPLRHLPGSPHRGRHRLSPNKRYSKSGLPI